MLISCGAVLCGASVGKILVGLFPGGSCRRAAVVWSVFTFFLSAANIAIEEKPFCHLP